MADNRYVNTIYDPSNKPFTNYPSKLTSYLISKYSLNKNKTILDLGCGRGEFLKGFIDNGFIGYGVDQSDIAKQICPTATVKITNLQGNKLPFKNNFFDYIFSKSVIEHFYYPEEILKECYRVLKPGGKIITMCPSWEYNYKIYFEDYTHRTPFMLSSLRDLHIINNFKDVEVNYFRQLPFIWNYPFMIIFTEFCRIFMPQFVNKYSKLVRFSKEVMLIAVAVK